MYNISFCVIIALLLKINYKYFVTNFTKKNKKTNHRKRKLKDKNLH